MPPGQHPPPPPPPMPFQHFGHGGGHHTLAWLFVIGIFLLVAVVVYFAMRYANQPIAGVPAGAVTTSSQDLLGVVDRRYAHGQITREEYLRIRADLGGPPVPAGEPLPPE